MLSAVTEGGTNIGARFKCAGMGKSLRRRKIAAKSSGFIAVSGIGYVTGSQNDVEQAIAIHIDNNGPNRLETSQLERLVKRKMTRVGRVVQVDGDRIGLIEQRKDDVRKSIAIDVRDRDLSGNIADRKCDRRIQCRSIGYRSGDRDPAADQIPPLAA